MEYTKETTVGDVTTYERYEGTPEEIARLVMLLPQELKGGELGQGIYVSALEEKSCFDTNTVIQNLTEHISKAPGIKAFY